MPSPMDTVSRVRPFMLIKHPPFLFDGVVIDGPTPLPPMPNRTIIAPPPATPHPTPPTNISTPTVRV